MISSACELAGYLGLQGVYSRRSSSFALDSNGELIVGTSGARVDGRKGSGWSTADEASLTDDLLRKWDAEIVSRLPEHIAGAVCRWDKEGRELKTLWIPLARLVEAAARAAKTKADEGNPDARLALPLFERLRFVVLTIPFRTSIFDGEGCEPFPQPDGEPAFRARRARESWAQMLLTSGEHIVLEQFGPEWLEREARLLVFQQAPLQKSQKSVREPLVLSSGADPDDGERRQAGKPVWDLLVLSSDRNHKHDEDRYRPGAAWWSREDEGQHAARQFVAFIGRETFLRRMMIIDAIRIAWRAWGSGTRGRSARWILGICLALLVGAAAAVPLVAAGVGPVYLPAIPGAAAYFLAVVGILRCGPLLGDALCLRLPAATAVGVAVLITLPADWWKRGDWRVPTVALVFAAAGYLAIEARANGVNANAALRRAGAVFALGALHAVAVSAIAFSLAAGVFYEDTLYLEYWEDGQLAMQAILLGAAVGLALGVFLQVLWEDRPVTYPLAHIEWRSPR